MTDRLRASRNYVGAFYVSIGLGSLTRYLVPAQDREFSPLLLPPEGRSEGPEWEGLNVAILSSFGSLQFAGEELGPLIGRRGLCVCLCMKLETCLSVFRM